MRSFEVPAFVTLGLACLAGCGGATPAPVTPTQDSAIVNLDASSPAAAKPKAEAESNARKGPQDDPDRPAARAPAPGEFGGASALSALRDEDLVNLMMGLGAPNGAAGGTLGGLGSVGGFSLSGVGAGGGGTGIGVASVGTIGHGSRPENAYVSPSPVQGESVLASPTGVVELGDSLTLGVSLEEVARVLRRRIHTLRDCYAERLTGPKQAGSVTLRFVVGREGRVVHSRHIASDYTDASFLKCVSTVPLAAYLGVPAGGQPGVVETIVRFSPPLKK